MGVNRQLHIVGQCFSHGFRQEERVFRGSFYWNSQRDPTGAHGLPCGCSSFILCFFLSHPLSFSPSL